MMYKKNIFIVIIIGIFLVNNVGLTYASEKENKKTLIIYETKKEFADKTNYLNHLNELLYVFSERIDTVQIDDYKSNQLSGYDFIFVLNIENNIKNNFLLNDLSISNKNIYWIGNKIENLLDYSKKYMIKYNGKNDNIINLNYKNNKISINGTTPFNIIEKGNKSVVLSTMDDGYKTYPYALREGNLYYISNWNIHQSYIFEDTLNDFFSVKKFENGRIFIEISNVNPYSNTKKLYKIADYLSQENLPFIISLTPTCKDAKDNLVTLNDKIEVVNAIKYMQEKGGLVILNGYSHNNEGKLSYEFWNNKKDKNISEQESIKNRALSGLRLCIENEIYPIGFEAQNGAMKQSGYKEIKKYFETYIGRYQNDDDEFSISTFPYIIEQSQNFNTLIPENLGELNYNNKFSIENIQENFYKLSMVRGYTGGFYFNPDIKLDYLKECIDYFKLKNVDFLDFKIEKNEVEVDDIKIEANKGEIDVDYDKTKSFDSSKKELTSNITMKNLNNTVVTFVIVILVLFIFIFIIFKVINKRKFIRRKK